MNLSFDIIILTTQNMIESFVHDWSNVIENQMKEPRQMIARFGTINISMFLVTLIYVILGFFGYWRFYDVLIQGSITLNLPQEDW